MIAGVWRMYRFVREHRFTQAHLSEYIDGELSARDAQRVLDHVELCQECRRLLEQLRKTVAGLARLRPGQASRLLADAVIERLRTVD